MSKIGLLEHKGYYGSIHFNAEDEIFYGKVEFIRDLLSYEALDAKTLVSSFKETVEEYISDCEELNKIPDKSFKGSFNVRVSPELHKQIGLYAINKGETLNNVIKKAIDQFIRHEKSA